MVEASEKTSSYEGYLSKGGKNLLIQFPKRYFRILGGALFWYKSKDDTAPLGDILLSDVTEILIKAKHKDGIPFDIVTGKRSLNLIAPTQAVVDYWVGGFGNVKVSREPDPSGSEPGKEIKRTTSLMGLKQKYNSANSRNSGDAALPVELHKNRDNKDKSGNVHKTTEKPNEQQSSEPSNSKPPSSVDIPHGSVKNIINTLNQNTPPTASPITTDSRGRAGSVDTLHHSSSVPNIIYTTDSSNNAINNENTSQPHTSLPSTTTPSNHIANSTPIKKPRGNTRSLDTSIELHTQPALTSAKSPKPLPSIPLSTSTSTSASASTSSTSSSSTSSSSTSTSTHETTKGSATSPRPLPMPRSKNEVNEVQPIIDNPEQEINEGAVSEYAGYTTVCYAVAHSGFSGEGEVGSVLELTVGMVIGIVEQGEDGWWLGYPLHTMDPLGYFPGSYVDVLDSEAAAKCMLKEDKKKKSSTLSFSVSIGGAFDPQKRANTAKEILATEQSYVKFIDVLIKSYEQPFAHWISQSNVATVVTRDDIKNVFLNVSQIYPLNQELLSRLETTMAMPNPNIGDVFLQMAPFLKIYNEFGNRYQSAIDTLNRIRLDSGFLQLETDCHNKAGRQNSLENLLIMPVQRIPRYILLLEELLKSTPSDHIDYAPLQRAIAQVKLVAHSFNESVKKFSNTQRLLSITKGVEQLLAPHRVLIQENTIQVEKRSLNSTAVIQRGAYQLLVFNDILVFAQKGEVIITYPLDLVWMDTSGNLVGTTPLEIGLVVPAASYNIKLVNNNNVQAKQELMKCIINAIADYQRKNPPSEPPPFSSSGATTVSRVSSLMPAVRFGKFVLGIDVVYDGWWNWGKFHLSGSYECHGNNYIGEWDNGLKSGMGTCHFNTGEVYSGSWSGDSPNGKGQLIFLDGDVYIGDWKDGKMSGDGELQYVNENRYRGAWKDGLPHGHGVFTSKTTEKDGTWAAGKLNGYGTERHMNGWMYNGYWHNDKWEGRGIIHYTDNFIYEGSWKDSQRHGNGKLIERTPRPTVVEAIHSSGDGVVVYDGEWVNDKMEGRGVMHYPGGSVYTGQWKDGKRNGTGVMGDGKYEKYEGDWVNDRKQGRGVLTTLGGKYEGTFRDDRYHGLGVLILADGSMLEGRWLQGNLEGRCIITTKQENTGKNITTIMIAKEKESIAVFGDNTEIVRLPSLPLLD